MNCEEAKWHIELCDDCLRFANSLFLSRMNRAMSRKEKSARGRKGGRASVRARLSAKERAEYDLLKFQVESMGMRTAKTTMRVAAFENLLRRENTLSRPSTAARPKAAAAKPKPVRAHDLERDL